jgi:SOS response regulatory protein OraA/RecX
MTKGVLKSAIIGIVALMLFILITYMFRDSESLVVVMLVVGAVLIIGFMVFLKSQVEAWSESIGVEEHSEEGFRLQQENFNPIDNLIPLERMNQPIIYPKIIEKKEENLQQDDYEKLRDYIIKNFRKGKTEDEVRNALHKVGWSKEHIDKALNDIKKKPEIKKVHKDAIKEKLDSLNKTIKDIEKKKY